VKEAREQGILEILGHAFKGTPGTGHTCRPPAPPPRGCRRTPASCIMTGPSSVFVDVYARRRPRP
jgi:hypothetical protein